MSMTTYHDEPVSGPSLPCAILNQEVRVVRCMKYDLLSLFNVHQGPSEAVSSFLFIALHINIKMYF